jgi:hypothetical protein
LGSLGCARSTKQNIGIFLANARSVHRKFVELEKNVSGGHTRVTTTQGKPLVVEYLRGEYVQQEKKEIDSLRNL